jgi:ubiquinone biosynthesis protein
MSLLAVPDLHFRRYRQIAEVLTRHGLRWLRDASGLGRFRPLRFDLDEGDQVESLTAAVRVRLTLEELGATFIKLGQFLSTRADLLPPEYQTELAKLRDSAPPFDSKTAKEMIKAEFGQPTSALFADFDLNSLAAASIGQAHAATLLSVYRPPVWENRAGVMFAVGFFFALALGIYLALSILRSGRD